MNINLCMNVINIIYINNFLIQSDFYNIKFYLINYYICYNKISFSIFYDR